MSATGTGSMHCHILDHAGSHTLSSPAPLPPPVTTTRVLDGQTTKSRTASGLAHAGVLAAAARFVQSAAGGPAVVALSAAPPAPLDSILPRQAAASDAGSIETTMYAAKFERMTRRGAGQIAVGAEQVTWLCDAGDAGVEEFGAVDDVLHSTISPLQTGRGVRPRCAESVIFRAKIHLRVWMGFERGGGGGRLPPKPGPGRR